MLDLELSNDEYKVYTNISKKDGRIRCLLIHKDGTRKNKSYPKLLMEKFLGRELSQDEQIHHKDGNPLNNELSNLEIVPLGVHQSFHSKGKHYEVSDELRLIRSNNAKKLWKDGLYDNRDNQKITSQKSEETKEKIRLSLLKYNEAKRASKSGGFE